MAASPLLPAMVEAGGVKGEYHGQTLVRHFGDPAGEYEAATRAVAVFDRSHRTRLVVSGRAPGQMLSGVLTGTIPDAPNEVSAVGQNDVGVWAGRCTYQAVLTPKGKMVTDLWIALVGDEEPSFLLDVPVAGRAGLLELLGKVLPPRFASVRDVSGESSMISLVGPDAAHVVSEHVLGGRVTAEELEALEEGEWRGLGSSAEALLMATRTMEVVPTAYSVMGSSDAIVSLWKTVVGKGCRPSGLGVWSTLRVEAGRPTFGTDMDSDTIPIEAGIEDRAIDHTKGCYTGQEVIVRIRDRGHVNRHLRRLEIGDVPTPARGAELLSADGSGKVVGRVTSAVQSPARGGVIVLAYVARGAERVLLDGTEVEVPS